MLDQRIEKQGQHFLEDPDNWINKPIRVWWDDDDGKRWESGTIIRRTTPCFFIIKYPFLERWAKENPTEIEKWVEKNPTENIPEGYPEVKENLLGKHRVKWEFV